MVGRLLALRQRRQSFDFRYPGIDPQTTGNRADRHLAISPRQRGIQVKFSCRTSSSQGWKPAAVRL